jgi:2,5-furandicarboxylate decarboxylase 1
MTLLSKAAGAVDTERFRLRAFVERLVELGECVVHDEPIDLVDVASKLDGCPKAVWFRNAGGGELVGNVMGSRHRLAIALGADEKSIGDVMRERLLTRHAPVEVASADAPVHEVVQIGADADLTSLPVHLQHALDGAPYISASLDFARDAATGWTNVGCRRIMVRTPSSAGIDLNAPSDLRAMYAAATARGERLPVAYAIGSHPLDFLGAMAATEPCDELTVLGAMRGAPVPVVKCKTLDAYVPADAEFVIEGYLDERGLVEPEGPYGEYIGYYGTMKRNPVFHVTAITSRRKPLFQTATIGGRWIGFTDTAQLGSVKTEATIGTILRHAVREPRSVYCTASSGGMYNVRVSLRQRYPGEARNVIAAVFASVADAKHVFVVDEDVDVFDDHQIDWALATRFQADRDLVVESGFRAVPLDPSLAGSRVGAKAGFDMTKPAGKADAMEYTIPDAPAFVTAPQRTVLEALTAGPCTFLDLMEATGTRDGREVVRAFDALYEQQRLGRADDGCYILVDAPKNVKGRT